MNIEEVIDAERQICAECTRVVQEAFSELHRRQLSMLEKAIFGLGVHVANNWKAICCLAMTHTQPTERESIANQITILVRSMYDAIIQANYICHDPTRAVQLAKDYLDFAYVEKYANIIRVESGKCALAKRVATSQLATLRREEFVQQFNAVKARYAVTGKKDKVRSHWYKGSLADIAKVVGMEEEYNWYFTFSNSAVHAGPLAVIKGPQDPSGPLPIMVPSSIALQMMRLLAKECSLNLSQRSLKVIDKLGMEFIHSEVYCSAIK